MEQRTPPPDLDALIEELKKLRRRGLVNARHLDLAGLKQACHSSGRVDENRPVSVGAVQALIRQAIADLENGVWTATGRIIYGLDPDYGHLKPSDLRTKAAQHVGASRKTWNERREPVVIEQIATTIERWCEEHQMRLAILDLERRTPASSRLAVAWLARFEAYYSMWTPIYALAADLTAYRSTLLEEDRPWDRPPTPEDPEGYTQELQAAGYATNAYFYLAELLAKLNRFEARFGGLWLLSDKQTETEVADAVAQIRRHTPHNERDDSYLQIVFDEVGGQLHHFRSRGATDKTLVDMHDEWQQFVAVCPCRWPLDERPRGYFPTTFDSPDIDATCPVHQIIAAANTYCTLIDDDWDRIADWYRITDRRQRGPMPEEDYQRLYEWAQDRGMERWPPWHPE